MRWVVALLALAGCQTIFGLDHVDPRKADAAGDTPKVFMDAPPAGIVCAGVAGAPLHLCAPEAMLQGETYSTNITINTDVDAMCTRVESIPGRQGEVCELITSDLTISGGATLTAIGSRPLVLVAMGTLTIGGVVDVSTYSGSNAIGAAADDASCVVVNGPVQQPGLDTSAGGAGGSFGSRGGDGGAPAQGTAVVASNGVDPATLMVLRGGCHGGAGGTDHSGHTAAGGHSGGAVYLMGGTAVTIAGKVLANGAGGQGGASTLATDYAGGAGGGTGGLIMIDTPSLMISGVVMANGGAGGAGCSDNAAAGGPGADPMTPAIPAKGGVPTGDGTGGTGGNGSTQLPPQPGGFGDPAGTVHAGAGAGGGGGKGVVRVFGSAVAGGTIVPAAT